MGTGSFPGVKCGWGVLLTTHPLPRPRSRKGRAIRHPPLRPSRPVTGELVHELIMRDKKNQKHAVPRSSKYGGRNGCMFKVSYKANYREILLFYNNILKKSYKKIRWRTFFNNHFWKQLVTISEEHSTRMSRLTKCVRQQKCERRAST
jgi:hypothetical protein